MSDGAGRQSVALGVARAWPAATASPAATSDAARQFELVLDRLPQVGIEQEVRVVEARAMAASMTAVSRPPPGRQRCGPGRCCGCGQGYAPRTICHAFIGGLGLIPNIRESESTDPWARANRSSVRLIDMGVDVSSADETIPVVRETERQALPRLRSVLEMAAAGRIRCSDKTKRPTAASVAELAEVLPGGDFYPDVPIASFGWPLLMQAGGLAQLNGTKLALTPRGRGVLATPTAAAVRDLWRRWLTNGAIDEFSRIDAIKGQGIPNVLTAVRGRRAVVQDTLRRLTVGDWVGVDELFGRMRRGRQNPKVARGERALFRLYIGHVEYGSLGYAGYSDWPIVEGRYTLAVLFEYAATLGLIDVKYVRPEGARTDYHENWGTDDLPFLSRYDGLLALRLNALGGYATDITAEYSAPVAFRTEPGTISVLANLDVVMLGESDSTVISLLTRFADRTSDRVFRLSKQRLLEALGNNHHLDELAAFLGEVAELPDTVRQLLTDVSAIAGAVADRGVVRLVECTDPATVVMITRDRTLRRYCTPVGTHHLAVDLQHEGAFRAGLLRAGFVLTASQAES